MGCGHGAEVLTLWLQEYCGTLERDGQTTLRVMGRAGDTLDVLLENMGRISFGANISDFKVRAVGPGALDGMAWPPVWPNSPSSAIHNRPWPWHGHPKPAFLVNLTPPLGKPTRIRL